MRRAGGFLAVMAVVAWTLSVRADTLVSGWINTSTTWTTAGSPYVLTGNVSLNNGVTLTIQPGVTVKSGTGMILDLYGTLSAVGTSVSPITFTTSGTPAAGAWGTIYFEPGSDASASRISYATVSDGGGLWGGAIRVDNSSPHFDHLTISSSGSAGMYVTGGSASPFLDTSTVTTSTTYGLNVDVGPRPTVTNTTFTSNGSYAISVNKNANLLGLNGVTGSGNGVDGIEQRGGGIGIAVTWHACALPWIVTGNFDVSNPGTLTIDAGTTVKFAPDMGMSFDNVGTQLTAIGTSANPITFTSSSASPAAGAWAGISFWGGSSSQSRISYATIAWAGGANGGAIRVDSSSPHFDHLTISSSGSAGIYVTGGSASPFLDASTVTTSTTYGVNVDVGPSPTVTNTTFTSNGSYAISVNKNANVLGLTGVTGSGNGVDGIEQRGGSTTIAIAWHVCALPWIVTGDVNLWYPGTLTIDAGVTVKFAAGTQLAFNNDTTRLTAVGTSTNPITFTSSSPSPAAGAWVGIAFWGGSSPQSRISYATIVWAGGGANGGALRIEGTSPQFDHLTITSSGSAGINVTGGAAPTIDSSTISGSTTYGVNVNGGTSPTITNTTFTNNGSYAISVSPNGYLLGLTGLSGSGNGGGTKDGIEQRGGTINTATTWHVSAFPWFITSDVNVWNPGGLAIDAGTTVKFAAGTQLTINNVGTQLTAVGTSATPITFTSSSATPAAGAWVGIALWGGSSTQSRISYATISWAGGGGNGGALLVDALSLQFDHVTISGSSSSALRATTAGATACSNCQFLTSASGVTVSGSAAPDVRNAYWGASSGPSGLGPGTGTSVAGSATSFEPWLTAAPTAVQYYSSVGVVNRTFNPTIGTSATVQFATPLSGSWSETVKDSTGKSIRTLTGTGTSGNAVWDGKDSRNRIQANGTYTYDLTSTATGGTTAPLHGRLIIDSTKLPVVSNATEAPPFFSPNADGVQDTALATASVNFDDAAWTAHVKNSGGTVIRTVTLAAGASMNFAWDGKNDSAVVQPDGTYTIDCVATTGSASNTATVSVVLDNTLPAVAITAPAGGTLSNVHQSGNATLSVVGSVSDTHLTNWTLDYGLGSTPASWTTLATGTAAVSNAQLATWQTFPITNGGYTLRLQGWDSAGNRGVVTQFDTIGNFHLTQPAYQVSTGTGQTQTFTSTVPFTVTEVLAIRNLAGSVVRTLFNGTRGAGSFNDVWDGRTDAGALLPDGPYFTSVTVSDNVASQSFAAAGPATDGLHDYYYMAQSPSFDPFNNQPLGLTYTFPLPGKVTLFFSTIAQPTDACDPPNYCLIRDQYQQAGTFTVYWSGVDDTGQLRNDLTMTGISSMRLQFDNSVTITFGTAPSVSPPTVTPPFYGPAFAAQTIALDLSTYQSQPATVAIAFRNQASGSVLRTITQGGVAPGHATFTWDGRSDDGHWVAPGVYIVTATVTDAVGNVVTQKILTNVSY